MGNGRMVTRGVAVVATMVAAFLLAILFLDYRDLHGVAQEVVAEIAADRLDKGDPTAAGLAVKQRAADTLLKRIVAGNDSARLTSVAAQAARDITDVGVFPINRADYVNDVSVSQSRGLLAAVYEKGLDVYSIYSGERVIEHWFGADEAIIEDAVFVRDGEYLLVRLFNSQTADSRLILLSPVGDHMEEAAAYDDAGDYGALVSARALSVGGWFELIFEDAAVAWRPFPDGRRLVFRKDESRSPIRIAVSANGVFAAAIMDPARVLRGERALSAVTVFAANDSGRVTPIKSFSYGIQSEAGERRDEQAVDLAFDRNSDALIVAYRAGNIRVFAEQEPDSIQSVYGSLFGGTRTTRPNADNGKKEWRDLQRGANLAGYGDLPRNTVPLQLSPGSLRLIQNAGLLLVSGITFNIDEKENRSEYHTNLFFIEPRASTWTTSNPDVRSVWRSDSYWAGSTSGVARPLDYQLTIDERYIATNDDRSVFVWRFGDCGARFLKHIGRPITDEISLGFDRSARRRGSFQTFIVDGPNDKSPTLVTVRRNMLIAGEGLSTLVRVHRFDSTGKPAWSSRQRLDVTEIVRQNVRLPVKVSALADVASSDGHIAVAKADIDLSCGANGAGSVAIFDDATGVALSNIDIQSDQARDPVISVPFAVALSKPASRLAVLDAGGEVTIWGDYEEQPKKLGAFNALGGDLRTVLSMMLPVEHLHGDLPEMRLSANGETLAIFADRKVDVWSLFQEGEFSPRPTDRFDAVTMHAGGDKLAFIDKGNALTILDISSGLRMDTAAFNEGPALSAGLSPDGLWTAAVGIDGRISVLGPDTVEPITFSAAEIFGDHDALNIVIPNGGKRVYLRLDDGRIAAFDTRNGKRRWVRSFADQRNPLMKATDRFQHMKEYDTLQISADGDYLCASSPVNGAVLMRARDGGVMAHFDDDLGERASFRCGASDGSLYAFGVRGVEVWTRPPRNAADAMAQLDKALPMGAHEVSHHIPSASGGIGEHGRRLLAILDALSGHRHAPKEQSATEEGESQ